MKFRPLQDKVLVKFEKKEEVKSAFGLIIPSTAVDKPDSGEVLAVGEGKYNEDGIFKPTSVQVGDLVLFSKFAAQIITIDKEDFLSMTEDNIIGIIKQ